MQCCTSVEDWCCKRIRLITHSTETIFCGTTMHDWNTNVFRTTGSKLLLTIEDMLNVHDVFTLPELSFPLTMTQMVGYYQDPEGKTVFSRTDPSKLARDTNTSDTQRKQTQELENGVSVTINMGVT